MERITLRGTELSVSPLCLGTAQYGTGLSAEHAMAQLSHYVEHGGNFIDTAHVYGDWMTEGGALSEAVIGRWLHETGNRSRVVIATKGAHPRFASMNAPRCSDGDIIADLEGSLKSLGVETVDLYFLHRDDPNRPVEDILYCLEKARSAGKIRHYGCSNWTLGRMQEAERAARDNGVEGFSCNQTMWSLADINSAGLSDKTLVPMDREMYHYHMETGLSAMAYTSLGKGYFMRRATGQPLPADITSTYENPSNDAFYRLMDDAYDIGFDAMDLSLRYLVQQRFPGVAIAAFSSLTHLDEALRSAGKTLPDKLMEALCKIKRFVY